MTTNKRRYFLASGPDEKAVLDFFERRQAAFAASRGIAKRHGGEAVTRGSSMVGVAHRSPPQGWRHAGRTEDGRDFYIPAARSKAGKAALAEIRSVKIPDASDLHSRLTKEGFAWGEAGPRGGFYILYITAEIVDGKCVIHVPESMKFKPKHSKPLKDSEYWSLIESAKQTA